MTVKAYICPYIQCRQRKNCTCGSVHKPISRVVRMTGRGISGDMSLSGNEESLTLQQCTGSECPYHPNKDVYCVEFDIEHDVLKEDYLNEDEDVYKLIKTHASYNYWKTIRKEKHERKKSKTFKDDS